MRTHADNKPQNLRLIVRKVVTLLKSEDRRHLGKTFEQVRCSTLGLHYLCHKSNTYVHT